VIAPVIGLVIRLKIPEPPRWYVLRNRIEDAKKSLDTIGISQEAIEEFMLPALRGKTKAAEFKPFVFPVLLPLFIAFFLQSLAFTSLTILAPTFLAGLGISASNAVLFTAAAFALPQLVGVLIALAVVNRIERRTIAWIGNLWGAISLGLLGVFAHISSLYLLLLLLFIADVSNGFVLPVLGGMASEFFTARTRATGQGISTSAFRWSGFAGGIISPILLLAYGLSTVFYVYSISAFIAFLVAFFWLTKAKVTKSSLEQISTSFIGGTSQQK
jgi:MFS family permease